MTKKEIQKIKDYYIAKRNDLNLSRELMKSQYNTISERDTFKRIAEREFQECLAIETMFDKLFNMDLYNEWLETL